MKKNKNILKLILILIIAIFSLFGCNEKDIEEATQLETTQGELPKVEEYIILHTNDIHSYINGEGNHISVEDIVSIVSYYKDNYENVLVFDAGDMTNAFSNDIDFMPEIANRIGYDAWTLGNNDDIELINKMNFPMISSNLNIEGYPNSKSSIIIEEGGLKIGIFGLSVYSRYVEEISTKTEAAYAAVEELKAKGADFIICLSHLGTTGDDSSYSLASSVEGIDLIIDGNSHTLLETGTMIGDTLVVQAGEHLEYIGVVKLYVRDNEVLSMEASVIPKEGM